MFLNKKTNYHELSTHDDAIGQFFFKQNVRYPLWTCKDPISLILWT